MGAQEALRRVFLGFCTVLGALDREERLLEKRMGGRRDAGIPDRHPSEPPARLSNYPTKNECSEMAEIICKVGERNNWFGMSEMEWGGGEEGVDTRMRCGL